MIPTDFQPTIELKIKRSESKNICDEVHREYYPDGSYKDVICGAKIEHYQYSEECSDIECSYYREYEEETEGDEDPTVYDYEAGIIIK